MRDVIAAAERSDEHARMALDVFVHRISAGIGAILASLGGLDALVFTGGIGENVPLVRERSCRPFDFLGVHIDAALNPQGPERDIATAESAVRVLVIRTEEDWEIARDCWRVLAA
jgi:acetate kinase